MQVLQSRQVPAKETHQRLSISSSSGAEGESEANQFAQTRQTDAHVVQLMQETRGTKTYHASNVPLAGSQEEDSRRCCTISSSRNSRATCTCF